MFGIDSSNSLPDYAMFGRRTSGKFVSREKYVYSKYKTAELREPVGAETSVHLNDLPLSFLPSWGLDLRQEGGRWLRAKRNDLGGRGIEYVGGPRSAIGGSFPGGILAAATVIEGSRVASLTRRALSTREKKIKTSLGGDRRSEGVESDTGGTHRH